MLDESLDKDMESMYYIESLYFLISTDNNDGLVFSRVLYFGENGDGMIYIFDPTGHQDATEKPIRYINKLDEDNAVVYHVEGDSTAYMMIVEDWVVPHPDFDIAFPKEIKVMNTSTGQMLYGGLITESRVMDLLDGAGYANLRGNDDSDGISPERISTMTTTDNASPSLNTGAGAASVAPSAAPSTISSAASSATTGRSASSGASTASSASSSSGTAASSGSAAKGGTASASSASASTSASSASASQTNAAKAPAAAKASVKRQSNSQNNSLNELRQSIEKAKEKGREAERKAAQEAKEAGLTADPQKCKWCKGSGKCLFCGGVGKQRESSITGSMEAVPCAMCKGSGRCKKCGGTGISN